MFMWRGSNDVSHFGILSSDDGVLFQFHSADVTAVKCHIAREMDTTTTTVQQLVVTRRQTCMSRSTDPNVVTSVQLLGVTLQFHAPEQ